MICLKIAYTIRFKSNSTRDPGNLGHNCTDRVKPVCVPYVSGICHIATPFLSEAIDYSVL